MTREQFNDLAKRVSVYAKANPRPYRMRVALWAAMGYGVLLGAIALSILTIIALGVCIGQLWFWHLVEREGRFGVLAIGLVAAMALLLFSLVRSFFIRWPLPAGRPVSREETPKLFALIEQVAAATGAPIPHGVILTWEFNASVEQRPRWGWLGSTLDYLLIGLPLMAALTPDEFKAMLAHELGHTRGGHARFGNWIWRVRAIWEQLLARWANEGRKIGVVFGKFAGWYAPRFSAYSLALAREHEFEADAWAAKIAGSEVTAKVLIKHWLLGQRLSEEFWQRLDHWALRESEPGTGLFGRMLVILREPSTAEQKRRWLRIVLATETEGFDTHPAPLHRLDRLGLPFLSALDASEAIEQVGASSAIEAFLEEQRAANILAELEKSWRVVATPLWRQRFQQGEKMRQRVRELNEKATRYALDEKESWERTFLEAELAGDAAASRAILEKFVALWPQNAAAHFTLGKKLLMADEPAGIEAMERAIQLDSRFSAEGGALIAWFLRRDGQWEEAAARKLQAIRQADVLDASVQERLQIRAKDTFLPHGLNEEDIASLQAQLACHPRAAKAWLARKNVTLFPEHPLYVLVCVVRFRWWESASLKKLKPVLQELASAIEIAGTKDFLVLVHTNSGRIPKWSKAVRKVNPGGIYTADRSRVARRKEKQQSAPPPVPAAVPSDPVVCPPLSALSHDPVAPQNFPWIAVAVSLFVVILPLSYVARQIFRAGPLWRLAAQRHARNLSHAVTKEADAQRPIVIHPESATAESESQLALAWARRTMLEGYERAGRRDASWDDAARKFINESGPWWAGCRDAPSAKSLVPAVDELLRRGCNDPLILFLGGKIKLEAEPQSSEGGSLLDRALKGFVGSHYAKGVARLAAQAFVADCERRNDGTGQDRPAKKLWLRWFEEELTDGSYSVGEEPVLTQQLCRGIGSRLFKEHCHQSLETLRSARAGSLSAWAKLFLIGEAEISEGWKERGIGFSDSVTAKGWREFFKHLLLARESLVASWRANPRRPEAAGSMINVVMGEKDSHGETERLWFDRSTDAQFDFMPAYSHLLWAYRPRWGGSLRAMLSFGEECAKTQRYDTLVPMRFFSAVCSAAQEMEDNASIFRNLQVFGRLEQVLSNYEIEPTRRADRALFQGHHAYAAFLAGRFEKSYDLLREINFEIHPEVADDLNEGDTPESFIERVAAFGSAGGKKTLGGNAAALRGKSTHALALYREALSESESEPRAVHYIQSKISALEFSQRLQAGDWVPFQPSPKTNLVGWSAMLGSWMTDSDGSVVSQSAPNGSLLVNDAAVGPNFELRGEIEFPPGSTGEVQGGVAFGYPAWDTYEWRSVRLRRHPGNRSEVALAQHWKAGPTRYVATAEHNAFFIQSWQGKLNVILNGEIIFRDQVLAEGLVKSAGARVGLGAYAHEGNRFAVRYQNVQLRRLNTAPSLPPVSEIIAASNTR